MSTIIMSACWPLQMSASQKLVLMSLADQANDDGVCWPAVSTISERCCLSERAVQEALKYLETHAALVRMRRVQRSTLYRVTPSAYSGTATKVTHYVYRITHMPSGQFYIGLRSTYDDPAKDNYWGSGTASVWLQSKKAECSREIVATFQKRAEAAEFESMEIAGSIKNALCLNRKASAASGDAGKHHFNLEDCAPAAAAPADPAPERNSNEGEPPAPASPQNTALVGASSAPVTVIDPPDRTSMEPSSPAGLSAPPAAVDAETALQAACRQTWAAYAAAYQQRHSTAPVRNAKVNANVKQLVQRLGHSEAPLVAGWFPTVNERFVVQNMHDLGLLLAKAEAYRTQWATGRTMTQTRALQSDRTEANFNAADEAIALLNQRRTAHAR